MLHEKYYIFRLAHTSSADFIALIGLQFLENRWKKTYFAHDEAHDFVDLIAVVAGNNICRDGVGTLAKVKGFQGHTSTFAEHAVQDLNAIKHALLVQVVERRGVLAGT